jgi:hypothetical protein
MQPPWCKIIVGAVLQKCKLRSLLELLPIIWMEVIVGALLQPCGQVTAVTMWTVIIGAHWCNNEWGVHTRSDSCSVCGAAWCATTWLGPVLPAWRAGTRLFGNRALPPPPVDFWRWILCSSMNKNSVFIISDPVYMIKENNMILNVHCHNSTLYTRGAQTAAHEILHVAPLVSLFHNM